MSHSPVNLDADTLWQLQYIGRSRCAWCTNVDPSDAFYSRFHDGDKGPQVEPCCSACTMKGWSECVIMWDKDGEGLTCPLVDAKLLWEQGK